MTILSAKASVIAREADVTAAGRRTAPANGGPASGGRAAAILPVLAPILAPGREVGGVELVDGFVGGAGGGAGVGSAGLGLTVTCAVLRFPSLTAVTVAVPADFPVVSPED